MQLNHVQGVKGNHSIDYQSNMTAMKQDSLIQSLQKQIEMVQKKMDKLSDNKQLSMEDAMARRKELQKQLDTLHKELTQRRLEIQKEKQEQVKKIAETTEASHDFSKDIHNDKGEQVIGMDLTLNLLGTLRSTQVAMKGRARVLENEIKIDRARGASTEAKEDELGKIKDQLKNKVPDLMKDLVQDKSNDKVSQSSLDQSAETEDEKESLEDEDVRNEKVLYTQEGLKVEQETQDVETMTI